MPGCPVWRSPSTLPATSIWSADSLVHAVTPAELDRLLGVVLDAADSSFNPILDLGFAESIRREWRWRLARGESTRNLAAFEHLRPPDSDADH